MASLISTASFRAVGAVAANRRHLADDRSGALRENSYEAARQEVRLAASDLAPSQDGTRRDMMCCDAQVQKVGVSERLSGSPSPSA
jgi:hypothetical protein